MDRGFMSSGVFQFLDEVCEQSSALFSYGLLVGKGALVFDKGVLESRAELHNVLGRAEGTRRARSKPMDW